MRRSAGPEKLSEQENHGEMNKKRDITMETLKIGKNRQHIRALVILLLALFVVQTINLSHGQVSSNQWVMSFQTQKIGQDGTNKVFASSDRIQLCANVTYGNVAQPNVLVSFKVQGPVTLSNSVNITRIGVTDADGVAKFSFQLPAVGQGQNSPLGTWQAFATAQTTKGTIQKSLSFTVELPLTISTIAFLDSGGNGQNVFSSGSNMTVDVTVSNSDPSAQTASLVVETADVSGKEINYTQIPEIFVDSGSVNHLQVTFKVPSNAAVGTATVNATVYAGDYQSRNREAGQTKTAYFAIVSGALAGGAEINPEPKGTQASALLENSVSLFSWLLVATGFFTFFILFVFLKQRPMRATLQKPTLSPTLPRAPLFPISPKAKMEKPRESVLCKVSGAVLEPKVAAERSMTVTTTSLNPYETPESPELIAAIPASDKVNSIDKVEGSNEEASVEPVSAVIDRIINTARRIQTLKIVLDSEKKQLARDLALVSRNIDQQDATLNSKLRAMQEEIDRLKTLSGKIGFVKDEMDKLSSLATEADYDGGSEDEDAAQKERNNRQD
jgi:hypothetical protein